MRSLLVELDRIRSRRAIVLIVLAAALLAGLLAGSAAWDSRPVSALEQARAEAQAQAQASDRRVQEDLADCEADPEAYFGPGADPAVCEQFLVLAPRDFLPRQPLDLDSVRQSAGLGVVLLVTALLIMAGATFAGSDWSTGSMGNQLLFQPRRTRVWAAKLVAVTLFGLVSAGAVIGGFWAFLTLLADARGLPVSAEVLGEIRWLVARGTLLGAAATAGGYALTMLVRSTVATVGVLFAYAVAGEALVGTLPVERPTQWSLSNNVFAWVKDGTRVFDPDVVCRVGARSCDPNYVLGIGHGAAYLGALLLLAVAVSWVSFRGRDLP